MTPPELLIRDWIWDWIRHLQMDDDAMRLEVPVLGRKVAVHKDRVFIGRESSHMSLGKPIGKCGEEKVGRRDVHLVTISPFLEHLRSELHELDHYGSHEYAVNQHGRGKKPASVAITLVRIIEKILSVMLG